MELNLTAEDLLGDNTCALEEMNKVGRAYLSNNSILYQILPPWQVDEQNVVGDKAGRPLIIHRIDKPVVGVPLLNDDILGYRPPECPIYFDAVASTPATAAQQELQQGELVYEGAMDSLLKENVRRVVHHIDAALLNTVRQMLGREKVIGNPDNMVINTTRPEQPVFSRMMDTVTTGVNPEYAVANTNFVNELRMITTVATPPKNNLFGLKWIFVRPELLEDKTIYFFPGAGLGSHFVRNNLHFDVPHQFDKTLGDYVLSINCAVEMGAVINMESGIKRIRLAY